MCPNFNHPTIKKLADFYGKDYVYYLYSAIELGIQPKDINGQSSLLYSQLSKQFSGEELKDKFFTALSFKLDNREKLKEIPETSITLPITIGNKVEYSSEMITLSKYNDKNAIKHAEMYLSFTQEMEQELYNKHKVTKNQVFLDPYSISDIDSVWVTVQSLTEKEASWKHGTNPLFQSKATSNYDSSFEYEQKTGIPLKKSYDETMSSKIERFNWIVNKIKELSPETQVVFITDEEIPNIPNKDFSNSKAFKIRNTIFINVNKASTNDLIHEYGHLYINVLKSSPDWEKMRNKAISHKLFSELSDVYPDYEERVEEVIARLLEKRIAEYWDPTNVLFGDEIKDLSLNELIEKHAENAAKNSLLYSEYEESYLKELIEEMVQQGKLDKICK